MSNVIRVITQSCHLDSLRQWNPKQGLSSQEGWEQNSNLEALEVKVFSEGEWWCHSREEWHAECSVACESSRGLFNPEEIHVAKAASSHIPSHQPKAVFNEGLFCSQLLCKHSLRLYCAVVFKALSFIVSHLSLMATWVQRAWCGHEEPKAHSGTAVFPRPESKQGPLPCCAERAWGAWGYLRLLIHKLQVFSANQFLWYNFVHGILFLKSLKFSSVHWSIFFLLGLYFAFCLQTRSLSQGYSCVLLSFWYDCVFTAELFNGHLIAKDEV